LSKGAKGRLQVTVSVSLFAPKPHTPFQWVAQHTLEEFARKHDFLKEKLRGKFLRYRWHDAKTSMIEGSLARGDRKISEVIYRAWRLGSKFDAWTREFVFENWMRAFDDVGLDYRFYASRDRTPELKTEVLPWDHIDTGCGGAFLRVEFKRAIEGKKTDDCRFGECSACGVCQSLKVKNIICSDQSKVKE
ncbi:MAG: B12-binding domain-containing radical SAM protein, partial [Rubrobacteridae bacterium]|nr:B12-binding domain-containing radical SAM protein [Rubrobacteridae bacterium]